MTGIESEQEWIVTIDAHASLKAVEAELKHLGFVIVRVFDELGGLEVRGSATLAEKAKALPGVADVTESGTIDVGLPDALDS